MEDKVWGTSMGDKVWETSESRVGTCLGRWEREIFEHGKKLGAHMDHLQKVLSRLREDELYMKLFKCSFAQKQIDFLGHVIEEGRIKMDQQKIQTIIDWPPPKDIHTLRVFLGLAIGKTPKESHALGLGSQSKNCQFYIENGLLKVKGNRLYVPKGGDLRRTLLMEFHDTLWAGHPGEECTMALLRRAYY
uniref:Integrase zinc-binding domain-containing protein n=1 Tax=Nicotiana tabacum TaxID=4097 RepID=A0A1S3X8Y7_TOBAC|nr:PREDICTED: uncharacterized protein LOC107762370 [Nicotiana tabacum]